jgi:non-specific protein-tyrosine kinase
MGFHELRGQIQAVPVVLSCSLAEQLEEGVLEAKEILALLRRSWWFIILLTIAGGVAGYLLTPDPVPVYRATTTVLLSQGSDTLPDVQTISRGQALADTYGELMKSRPILEQVIADLGLDAAVISPEALARQITVTNVEGTNILKLSVTDTDRQLAADIANEIIRVFIDQNERIQRSRYATSKENLQQELQQVQDEMETTQTLLVETEAAIQELEQDLADLRQLQSAGTLTTAQSSRLDEMESQLAEQLVEQTRLRQQLTQQETRYQTLLTSFEEVRLLEAQSSDIMSVVEEALEGKPVTPAPKKALNAVQGAVGGIVVAVALAFLLNSLRASVIRSTEEIEKHTGLPTLGVIAEFKGADPADRLVTERQPRSPAAEAYRVLRTNIEFAAGDGPLRTLVVTSGSPVEGKTTTAANLAVALAQTGKRVILVDTDLRRPSVHKLFEQTNTRGVTTALLDDTTGAVSDHILPTGVDNLYLMPSGPLPPNPADLLGSQRMVHLVEDLARYADTVIFDTPPLLAVADAMLMARLTDATVLVVYAESTRVDMLRRAKDQIMQGGANLLGVVLNRAPTSGSGYGYYYYQYY